MGIAKIYDPLMIENKWLVKWEKEDFFKSEPNENNPILFSFPHPMLQEFYIWVTC